MSKRFISGVLAVLAVSFALGAQEPINCAASNLPPTSHESLFHYAVLAKAAYQKLDTWPPKLPDSCPQKVVDRLADVSIEVKPLPRHLMFDAKAAMERKANECGEPPPEIEFHSKEDGSSEDSVSCSRDTSPSTRLAMSFRYVTGNNEMTLVGKTLIVIGNTLFEFEDFRIVNMPRNGDKPEVIGVQGTDISDPIPQFTTSLSQLVENSCLFEFAAELSSIFFIDQAYSPIDEDEDGNLIYSGFSRRNAIVGHSLGGAIAQYVGHSDDIQSSIRNVNASIRRFDQHPTFGSYSFNSIGLPADTYGHWHHRRIRSVQVHGDFLAERQSMFGTRQLGQVYRYGLGLGDAKNNKEQLDRHAIDKVLEEICYCLDGKGSFVFDNQT